MFPLCLDYTSDVDNDRLRLTSRRQCGHPHREATKWRRFSEKHIGKVVWSTPAGRHDPWATSALSLQGVAVDANPHLPDRANVKHTWVKVVALSVQKIRHLLSLQCHQTVGWRPLIGVYHDRITLYGSLLSSYIWNGQRDCLRK